MLEIVEQWNVRSGVDRQQNDSFFGRWWNERGSFNVIEFDLSTLSLHVQQVKSKKNNRFKWSLLLLLLPVERLEMFFFFLMTMRTCNLCSNVHPMNSKRYNNDRSQFECSWRAVKRNRIFDNCVSYNFSVFKTQISHELNENRSLRKYPHTKKNQMKMFHFSTSSVAENVDSDDTKRRFDELMRVERRNGTKGRSESLQCSWRHASHRIQSDNCVCTRVLPRKILSRQNVRSSLIFCLERKKQMSWISAQMASGLSHRCHLNDRISIVAKHGRNKTAEFVVAWINEKANAQEFFFLVSHRQTNKSHSFTTRSTTFNRQNNELVVFARSSISK